MPEQGLEVPTASPHIEQGSSHLCSGLFQEPLTSLPTSRLLLVESTPQHIQRQPKRTALGALLASTESSFRAMVSSISSALHSRAPLSCHSLPASPPGPRYLPSRQVTSSRSLSHSGPRPTGLPSHLCWARPCPSFEAQPQCPSVETSSTHHRTWSRRPPTGCGARAFCCHPGRPSQKAGTLVPRDPARRPCMCPGTVLPTPGC